MIIKSQLRYMSGMTKCESMDDVTRVTSSVRIGDDYVVEVHDDYYMVVHLQDEPVQHGQAPYIGKQR